MTRKSGSGPASEWIKTKRAFSRTRAHRHIYLHLLLLYEYVAYVNGGDPLEFLSCVPVRMCIEMQPIYLHIIIYIYIYRIRARPAKSSQFRKGRKISFSFSRALFRSFQSFRLMAAVTQSLTFCGAAHETASHRATMRAVCVCVLANGTCVGWAGRKRMHRENVLGMKRNAFQCDWKYPG